MMFKSLFRCIHTSHRFCATDKSVLGALRKKTGYTFANCKKALELHNNDVSKAEQWLKDQAQTLGWSKATKLEGRSTKQGLVGLLIQKNIGAMVEVNCETDFVARNKNFQQFVETASRACVQHISNMPTNDVLSKVNFDTESLKSIVSEDGKSLGDHLALMIGNVSENATLRRATCFKTPDSISLMGTTHPTQLLTSTNVQWGKFGSIVAYKSSGDTTNNDDSIHRNICQHIIGMNPRKLGVENVDKPAEVKDDEGCLIYQEYLLDSSITVGELLAENGIEIVEFCRFECSENIVAIEENLNLAKASN